MSDSEDGMDHPEAIRLRNAYIRAKHVAKQALEEYAAFMTANKLRAEPFPDSDDDMDSFPPVRADDAVFEPSSTERLSALVGSISLQAVAAPAPAPAPAPASAPSPPPQPIRIEKKRVRVKRVNPNTKEETLWWKIYYEDESIKPDYQPRIE